MAESKDWHSPIEGSDRVTFEGGRLDEIVGIGGAAHLEYLGGAAHLEYLGGKRWFLSIGHDDGSETVVYFESATLKEPFMERRAPRTYGER